jgi:hypothetical protein
MLSECQNIRMLSRYEIYGHIAKEGFMPSYLVWHQHREVQAFATDESDGNDDEVHMNDMIADIGMEYDLGSGDQHSMSEVQNFYSLFTASYGDEIKVQLLESMLQRYRKIDY